MNAAQTVFVRMGEILLKDESEMHARFALSKENGVTPVDVAKLVMALEREWGFTLHDEKVALWRTLDDAVRHVERLLEEGLDQPTERSEAERTAWFYE